MNEFDKLRSWFLAVAGAAVLAGVAFFLADQADQFKPFVLVIGFLLAAAAVGVGVWALFKLEPWRHPSHH